MIEPTIPQDIVELFRARKTVMQMLRDRGYVVPPSKTEETLDQFWDKSKEESIRLHTFSAMKESESDGQDDGDKHILVFFP
jgi:DNA-directed RNA polymerase I, II, and III subunit RPABC1